MYPSAALNQLDREKAALQQRIQAQRQACAHAARSLARPLVWLDRAWVLGRRLAPFLPLALGLTGITRAWFRPRQAADPPKHPWAPWLRTGLDLLVRWCGPRSP